MSRKAELRHDLDYSFQLPLSGSRSRCSGRGRVHAFQLPLSGSLTLDELEATGKIVGNFQLPLSGSLCRTRRPVRLGARRAFNSLSRDHPFSALTAFFGEELSTPSLGITGYICCFDCDAGAVIFQLPLSGSHIIKPRQKHCLMRILSTPSLGITKMTWKKR